MRLQSAAPLILILSSVMAVSVPAASAQTQPHYLAGGKTFASDWRACVGFADGNAPDGSFTLDATGIYAYEFGCTFVDFKPIVPSPETGGITGHIVTASCGDDSGITRPDLFDLSFYDGIVTVTSQNDYMFDLLRPRADGDGETYGLVNRQFEQCQPG